MQLLQGSIHRPALPSKSRTIIAIFRVCGLNYVSMLKEQTCQPFIQITPDYTMHIVPYHASYLLQNAFKVTLFRVTLEILATLNSALMVEALKSSPARYDTAKIDNCSPVGQTKYLTCYHLRLQHIRFTKIQISNTRELCSNLS